MTEPRPAATVLLLREGPDGPLVFMVQRNRRSGFLPNAWVFPGGRVDATDALLGHRSVRGTLELADLGADRACAFGVAAVRETFEEAGIWLGTGSVPAERREGLARGAHALSAVLEETGAAIELARLRPWSWWVTPEVEPKRFDTRFLIAVTEQVEASHDRQETVDSRWVSPRAVLAASDQEGFPLAPPTWWTLIELLGYRTAQAAFDADRRIVPIQPVMRFTDAGLELDLPAAASEPSLPDRITWEAGWVAWRDGRRLAVDVRHRRPSDT